MKIGLIRCGRPDSSFNETPILSYTGEEIATAAQADIETIRWDLRKNNYGGNHFRNMCLSDILKIFKKAGRLFAEEEIEMGDTVVGPEEYARLYTLATGAPVSSPLRTMQRIKRYFAQMRDILAFQAIDGKIGAYSQGYVTRKNKRLGWIPRGRNLLVVTPSNHPAVNVLWTIASAMGYPITIRPSLDDPFTPLRLINALVKAGMPARSFSYYPIPHSYVDEMVDLFDRCMIFGGPQLVHKYGDRSATKVYGPGRSVMIVGQNYADRIDEVVNLAVTSMMKDGGRGCINLSTIIVQKNAAGIAEKIAREVASLEIFSPLDPRARIGAYRQKTIAEAINSQIAMGLYDDTDVTSTFRSSPRVVEKFDAAFLQPTVILCRSPLKKRETLFGREFSFPFVTVTEIPDLDEIVAAASGSLVVTLLSHNQALLNKLLFSPDIAKVYHGAIATTEIDFQDPHEGFISGFLFKTKALRIENDYDCQQG